MKVLIDLNKLSNLNCGLGQVAINFASEIAKTDSSLELNFLVPPSFVGYFGDRPNYFTNETIKKHLQDFDLWHSIHQEPSILPKDNTKLLLTIHDLNFIGEKSKFKAKIRLKKLQKIVNRSNHISFISEYSKTDAYKNLDLSNIHTSVIYNGVKTEVEMLPPIEKYDKFFFVIGVIKPKKNLHVLLPVMKYFPEHKLIIAGDRKGSYYKYLVRLANTLKIADRIVFIGTVSDPEKYWYYQNCDTLLFPSLFEGFGLPVVEALQLGTPVVTSNKSSLPEVGGGHTYLLETFDEIHIKEQIENAIQAYKTEEIKKSAIQYSKKFSWQTNVNQYLRLYSELLES